MAKSADVIHDNSDIRRKSVQMNKELIMDTAARLFAESSYESVSLDDIADKIGATKGLIYHYFPSKGTLLGELLLWNHDLFLLNVNPAWETAGADAADILKKVIKAHIEFCYDYSYIETIVYRTTNFVPVEMRKKINRVREAYARKFRLLVEEVQKTGQLVKGDSDSVAASIIALANYLPYRYRSGDSKRRKETYGLIVRLFFL
ncbi:MAG: TetR/AcrR family transcriptional regulator [Dehalococcoidia bacterium]|jgi:AcrR family transcriptional regulator